MAMESSTVMAPSSRAGSMWVWKSIILLRSKESVRNLGSKRPINQPFVFNRCTIKPRLDINHNPKRICSIRVPAFTKNGKGFGVKRFKSCMRDSVNNRIKRFLTFQVDQIDTVFMVRFIGIRHRVVYQWLNAVAAELFDDVNHPRV